MILRLLVLSQYQRVTDGQADRRTRPLSLGRFLAKLITTKSVQNERRRTIGKKDRNEKDNASYRTLRPVRCRAVKDGSTYSQQSQLGQSKLVEG